MYQLNERKYRLALVLSLMLLLLGSGYRAYANSNITIIVSGKQVEFNSNKGYPFVDSNYRTQVPLRSVAEASGARVDWDANRRVAIIKRGAITLEVPIGQPKIYKNGYAIYNDTSAILKNGRTYLPIRKVLELMNYEVMWQEEPPTIKAYKMDDAYALTKAGNLPAKYDLRNVNKLGSVRNQLQTTDCWAFASSATLQSKLLPGENLVFSPRHLRDYSRAGIVYEGGGGTQELAAAYYLNWLGPVKEEDYPFEGVDYNDDLKAVKHVMGLRLLKDKDYNGIKKAIMEHGAVYSAIFGESDTNEDNMINYETSAQHYVGKKDQNHAIAIVGWDDNYPKENFHVRPKNNGAFIVMNSYGTEWGDNGFYYVSYEDLHIGTYCAYYTEVEAADNYDNIYTTDDFGPTSWLTYHEKNALFGNAFVPSGMETIEAVGIYSLNSNMDVKIYMLQNFQDQNSFGNLIPQLIGSAKLSGYGYHTVKIKNSPAFNSKTAIIVMAWTTDEILKIPVEQAYIGMDHAFTISDGEGYFGSNWNMLDSEDYSRSNVILKLYTNEAK